MAENAIATIASDEGTAPHETRLSVSWQHLGARVIVGAAIFAAGFDMMSIAEALPTLVPAWGLTASQIGILVSVNFAGQVAGAIVFGWIADRLGRMTALSWSLGLFSVMSFICAFAWDEASLGIFRLVQGLGLGGAVPVAAVYVTEVAGAKSRGRFVLLHMLAFPVGLVAASLVGLWAVPHLGWRYMFVFGALPALLSLYLRRLVPESPHWVAEQKRRSAAGAAGTARSLYSWGELFASPSRERILVVWPMWFAAFFCSYGLVNALGIFYRSELRVPPDAEFNYNLVALAVGLAGALLCALTIDLIGRKAWFVLAFAGTTFALGVLSLHGVHSADQIFAYVATIFFLVNGVAVGLYVYTAELYPTHIRVLGVAAASIWQHVAFVAGPLITGTLVASNRELALLPFALAATIAIALAGIFATETAGRPLEGEPL
jgi:putative MFS transporter